MKNELIKILIVDDESAALDLMEELLNHMKGVRVVGKAANKIDAISLLIRQSPDVIFQDIQMQGENGLNLVDEYRKHNFNGKVVFVTAHSQYAIGAIKKAAFDYLLKPVDLDELQFLVLRLLTEFNKSESPDVVLNRKLKIPTRTGFILTSIKEIVYCEADGNYTQITKSDGEQLTTSVHLGKLEEDLDDNTFFRISRSVILNVNYLVAVNKGRQECTLKTSLGEIILHISSKRLGDLEEMI
jgi:DNA-binding LytR/AlgR family response regulator